MCAYLKNSVNETIFTMEKGNDKQDDKKYVLGKIKQAHQILYEAENIEGENAMNDIMNLIFLRLIQDKLSDKKEDGKIDLLNKKYYDIYEDSELDDIFNCFKMDTLSKMALKTLRSKKDYDFIRKMGDILKKHPLTSQIFLENNFLKTEKATTLQHLIKTMFINEKTKWEVEKMYGIEDLIGEIFESFINGYTKTNSKLSQFFTPRNLMHLVLSYCEKDLRKDIKEEEEYHVADFCMGTGGWLVIFYNLFKEKYGDKIKLSGGEVKPNTFQYALMNIITTTNGMPYYVQRENSLTHIDKKKYHLIVTNPPFKTEFNFKNIETNFKQDEYTQQNKIKLENVYKLKNNNPPIQFLELCIYKLHEGGKCIIVLPYGELFFGSSYKKARDYFLDTIDITHIIICPSGVFTHTSIKTCVLIFNKSDKGTKEITFLQANKECNELIKIVSVKRKDINQEPNRSLYHKDYLNDEYITEISEKMRDFEWIEFGEVFTLEKGQLQSSKVEEDENGGAYMITQSCNRDDYKKIYSNKYDGPCLFIGNIDSGRQFPIIFFDGKCSCTNLLSYCKLKNIYTKKVCIKFIYYYLISIKKHLTKEYLKGSCNLSLDQKNFNRMKIPVPSLKYQELIVKKLDTLDDCVKKSEILIEKYKQILKIYLENTIPSDCEEKQIKDICEFLPKSKRPASYGQEEGKYPFYTSSLKVKYCDEADYEDECIIIGDGGKANLYFDCNFSCSDHNHILVTKNSTNNKYIFYYLKNNINLLNDGFKGLTIKNLSKNYVEQIKIKLPSLKEQKNIVKYCDSITTLIENLEEQINNNKKIMKEIINKLK